MKYYFLTIMFISSLFAGLYDVGEYISEDHQNIYMETCYAGNGYEVGDNWKLSDWNGDSNGGQYNVIVMILSASW